jgi:1-deoxy-D-xylulose-5-phosphate synthase
MNEQELRNLMFTAIQPNSGTFVIRYPRGEGVMPVWKTELEVLPIGKGRIVSEGDKDICVLSFGHPGNFVVKASNMLKDNEINIGHYDMRFVKPLDGDLLKRAFSNYKHIITIEDGCLQGGFGSAVIEWASENGFKNQVHRLGIPDRYVEHGEPAQLYREIGIDAEGIVSKVKEIIGVKKMSINEELLKVGLG